MEENFLTFQEFQSLEQALALTELLKQNNIEFLLNDTVTFSDPLFNYNKIAKGYVVKTRSEDFERANKLLVNDVDENYFLYNFNDEELIEVVKKVDEWGYFNYLLAQKILKEREKIISSDELENLKQQRIEELAYPDVLKNELVLRTHWLITLFFLGLILLIIGSTIRNWEKLKNIFYGRDWVPSLIIVTFIIGFLYLIYEKLNPRIIINDFGIWTKRNGLIEWSNIEKFSFDEEVDDEGYISYDLILLKRDTKKKIQIRLYGLDYKDSDIFGFIRKKARDYNKEN